MARSMKLLPSPMQAKLAVVTPSHFDPTAVAVRYAVQSRLEAWVLPEGTVPESVPHDAAAQHLKLLLEAWAARTAPQVLVARNLALRWLEEEPRVGIDPDVCVLDPAPPEGKELSSLCLWKQGHFPPSLCIEVVSRNHPHKDYTEIQDRYALVRTRELIVFDPLLAGPVALGGPFLIQLWRRDALGMLERVHASDQPVFSEVLDAWLQPTRTLLEIADDRAGKRRWPSWEEQARTWEARAEKERAEKEREREEKEREREEKERERAARLELERLLAEARAANGKPPKR